MPGRKIAEVIVHYTIISPGRNTAKTVAFGAWRPDGLPRPPNKDKTEDFDNAPPGDYVFSLTDPLEDATGLGFSLSEGGSGEIRVTGFTVKGEGANPFN